MTGRQIAFNGAGLPMEMLEAPVPELKPGELLVKNLYTTLCGSDLHTYCGKRVELCPTILGHEIVGEVLEIGPDHPGVDYEQKPLSRGSIITWSIFSSDPQSGYALNGIPQKGSGLFKYGHALLTDREVFHGGLAEYCILRKGTCILNVPAAIPLPVTATINCAVATVAGSLRMAGKLQEKNVLIFGTGMLGLTCAAMCREQGASWIGVADVDEKRLQEGGRFGASETIHLAENTGTVVQQVTEKFSRKGVDIVFDMSGSPEAMEMGIEMLAVGGTAVWIGAVFKNRKLLIDAEKIIRHVLTIRGLHNYNYDDFVYARDFIAGNWKKYSFEQMIEKEFSLDRAVEAFEYALKYKPFRVGIRI